MSMIPFFPSLRPTVGSSICIEADKPCDEESELREIEKEHVAWVSDIVSFGKIEFVSFGSNSRVVAFIFGGGIHRARHS